ncbi:acyltransferase family protein [Pararobbsia alpina]|uniref:O-acetyltransferase OatA n=1 Tax=Pararobbsia alpina TaxID=621374 RepID=A0A6S7CF04_9BURK|nr:acyltransferase family protein [Pararobbsia alpina]CAB3788222.1 hypothetical protein LMG28138_02565 [Pararobbsia alpina]
MKMSQKNMSPIEATETGRPRYRPDIDGLRAVAVAAVVLFHAFPRLLPGGFVGVDLFFVISGYLITRILCTDLQAGRYSIATFYARRVRRIFPALALVLTTTYVLGWFCLFNGEFKQLGKHIIAGVGFVSNWVLWGEAGYFDQAADTKPLLHLWSLSVEEQYYVFWPLLLAFAFKRGRVLITIVGVAILSFVLNVLLIPHHAAAAFFLPGSRVWELLAGALFAHLPQLQDRRGFRILLAPQYQNVLSTLGFALCIGSFIGFNSQLAFPGWWALLPVLGACLLIGAGIEGWVNQRVLAHPVAVGLGKISYPLYLWHWVLLTYATIIAGGNSPAFVRRGIVAISVGLAWLTTIVVERPVRFGPSRIAKVLVPCLAMLVVAYLGQMTYMRDGLDFRKGYSPNADVNTAKLGAGHEFVKASCGVASADQHLFQFCETDKRAVSHYAVWGDSKADALYWGLVRESSPGQSWTIIGRPSCAPMVGMRRTSSYVGDDSKDCVMADQKALHALIANPDLGTVVLVTAARVLTGQTYERTGDSRRDPSAALDGLDSAISALQRAGKHVALVVDNPTLPDPRSCMDRKPLALHVVRAALGVTAINASAKCAISYQKNLSRTTSYRAVIEQVKQRHPDLLVYDPASVLCDLKSGVCPIAMNGKFLYSYGDHISDYANGRIADQFLPLLRPSAIATSHDPSTRNVGTN